MAAARMEGNVGFVEDIVGLFTPGDRACMENILPLTSWISVRRASREILRRARLPESAPEHMPMGRSWSPSDIDLFARWVEDGSPKARAERHAAFFRQLDAVTEYFDVYGKPQTEYLMPHVLKYFGRDSEPGRRKALNIWQDYAVIPDDDPVKSEQRDLLQQELQQPEVSEAILAVDNVLLRLMRDQWAEAGLVDVELALEGVLSFGADRLPEDADRLARIRALNRPDDFRLTYALYHRMDSLVMWINWMAHVECATILRGSNDAGHAARTILLAALCLGYSADCVFRSRGQTRPEYYGADGGDRMWRKSVLISNDFGKALSEAHYLARLRVTMQAADVLAADKPIRFRSLRST